MDWTIYTMSDGAFLAQIFNAVAAITHSNEDSYFTAIKVMMMLGVLFAVGRSIIRPGKVNVGYIFFSIMMFYALIVPKVEVHIEDLYDGNVRIVDNVPLGVAVIGHISSNVGYVVSQWFEQGFTPPDATAGFTENGYIKGLQVLAGLRKALLSSGNYAATNEVGGGDFVQSWTNYIQDCTLVMVDLGDRSMTDVLEEPNLMQALFFDTVVYPTLINTNGTWQPLSCREAHETLVLSWDGAIYTSLLDSMRSAVFRPEEVAFVTGNDTEVELEQALSFIGQGGVDVKHFVATNILAPLVEEAAALKYAIDQKHTAAMMLEQAIAQRNVQWTAEQDVFLYYFRPLYTFFEGLVYAVTPIMGLLMMLGPAGFMLVGKQLMALFWIQLWLPMLAIANMYQYQALETALDAREILGDDFTSWFGLNMLSTELAAKIATGGMMAASAPALAGFLAFGTSVALTHIAGRIQGGDNVNEKYMAPDLSNTPPMMQMQSPFQADAYTGLRATHADGHIGSVMTRQDASAAVSSTARNLEAKQESFDKTLSSAARSLYSHAQGAGALGELTRSMASGVNIGESSSQSASRSFAERYANSEQAREAVRAGVNASVAASGNLELHDLLGAMKLGSGMKFSERELANVAKAKGGGDKIRALLHAIDARAGFRAGATGSSENEASHGQSRGLSLDDVNRAGRDSQIRSEFAEQLQSRLSDNKTERWEDQVSRTHGEDLRASHRELKHAERSHEAASRISDSMSMGQSMQGHEVGAALKHKGMVGQAKQAAHRVDVGQFNSLSKMYGHLVDDPEVAEGAAAMKVLASHGEFGKLAEIMNKAFGTNMDVGDAQGHAGLKDRTPIAGQTDVEQRTKASTGRAEDLMGRTAGLEDRVHEQYREGPQVENTRDLPGQADVRSHNADAREAVARDYAYSGNRPGAAAANGMGQFLMNKNVDTNFVSRAGGAAEGVADVIGDIGVRVGAGMGAGAVGAGEIGEMLGESWREMRGAPGAAEARESFNANKLTRMGVFGEGAQRDGAAQWLYHYANTDHQESDSTRAAQANEAYTEYMREQGLAGLALDDQQAMNVGAARAEVLARGGSLRESLDVDRITNAMSEHFDRQVGDRERPMFEAAKVRAEAAGVRSDAAQAVFATGVLTGTMGPGGGDWLSHETGVVDANIDDSRAWFVDQMLDQHPNAEPSMLERAHDALYEAGAKGSDAHATDVLSAANGYLRSLEGSDDYRTRRSTKGEF